MVNFIYNQSFSLSASEGWSLFVSFCSQWHFHHIHGAERSFASPNLPLAALDSAQVTQQDFGPGTASGKHLLYLFTTFSCKIPTF